MTLDQLPKNCLAIVQEIAFDQLPLKLIELGLVPDCEVEVLQKSFFNDPIYIRIDDNYVSIRKELARLITIDQKEVL